MILDTREPITDIALLYGLTAMEVKAILSQLERFQILKRKVLDLTGGNSLDAIYEGEISGIQNSINTLLILLENE